MNKAPGISIPLIVLTPLADLAPLHAASGLVKMHDSIYVIADDELCLAQFSLNGKELNSFPLIEGSLPADTKERKKLKPDWESLSVLDSGLLIVPSGSTEVRQTGFWMNQSVKAAPQKIDFSRLYGSLRKNFPELNIEGSALYGESLCLLQRGNGALGQNALIKLNSQQALHEIESSSLLSEKCISEITTVSLEPAKNASLGFTDACFCEGRLFFLAVAESSLSTYEDGEFLGGFLGCFDLSGTPQLIAALDCATKPEGLWVEKHNGRYTLYIVTDADNPKRSSLLLFGTIPAHVL